MKTCRCGTALEDLSTGKRMGYANCYKVFREEILASILPVQLREEHEGKQPSKLWKAEVDTLTKRMDRAAKRDDFETAAALKAQIQVIVQRHQSST